MIDERPILFFDSGIGGITTLVKCQQFLPNEHYLYYADTENMPYGDKPKKSLKATIYSIVSRLISTHHPKIVVLACNTATALVISDLRARYPEVIFVGAEPAVVPAIRKYHSILLLATANTLKYSKIVRLIERYHHISCLSPVDFATMVENNFDNQSVLHDYLGEMLGRYRGKFDCVVLGCTHYVFCKSIIRDILSTNVIDGNHGIASRVQSCLEVFDNHASTGDLRILGDVQTIERVNRAYKTCGGTMLCAV